MRLVERVFGPQASVAVSSWPAQESFIVHSNNLYRVGTLSHLSHLMLAWPGCPKSLSENLLDVEVPENSWTNIKELNAVMSEKLAIPRILELENEVRTFYCQSFFQFFGRPPILPLHLPK